MGSCSETNKSVTWKSGNRKYATVTSKGMVTMERAGRGKMVTITATEKDGIKKKATYKIKCMKGAWLEKPCVFCVIPCIVKGVFHRKTVV